MRAVFRWRRQCPSRATRLYGPATVPQCRAACVRSPKLPAVLPYSTRRTSPTRCRASAATCADVHARSPIAWIAARGCLDDTLTHDERGIRLAQDRGVRGDVETGQGQALLPRHAGPAPP